MDKQPVESPADEMVGWRVVDQDGNVVDSGPGIALEMVALMGEMEEEAGDGSD